MTMIALLLMFAWVYPVCLFTFPWTVLALCAAWRGWAWLWGAMAIGVLGLVGVSYFIVPAPDEEWPGVGFVRLGLTAWGILTLVVLAHWRSRCRENLDEL